MYLGAQASRQSRYDEAIYHFEKCVPLAPKNTVARVYLAMAYVRQYIPGAESPENLRMAEQALDQYQQVLARNPASPTRINSTAAMAYLYLQMKKFDDSRKYYQMASLLDPGNPENYYYIGLIDWTETYASGQEARAKLGMKPGDSLLSRDKDVCADLKEKNTANIQEGIDSLTRALRLRPDYDGAMAYMNLMYRARAEIRCDDPAARDADLKTADDSVDMAMAIKKAKEKKPDRGTKPTAEDPK
jgi:tetratricopeptide (TPR) repeat protein